MGGIGRGGIRMRGVWGRGGSIDGVFIGMGERGRGREGCGGGRNQDSHRNPLQFFEVLDTTRLVKGGRWRDWLSSRHRREGEASGCQTFIYIISRHSSHECRISPFDGFYCTLPKSTL